MPTKTRTRSDAGPKEPPKSTSDACACGYLDGVTVTVTKTGTISGETQQQTFQKPSRRLVCPHCGRRNSGWRQRYQAHAASVARSYASSDASVWDVCLKLDAEAADAADVDAEGSVRVWFDRLWPRLRTRLKRADSDAAYLGTASGLLKDGRYHFHFVLFSSLPRHRLREIFHGDAGINGYVQPPRPGESGERFATRKAAYAWNNAESAVRAYPNSDVKAYRFTASQGTGYDSANAREKRRDAVRGKKDTEEDTSVLVEEHGQTEERDKADANHKAADRTSSGAEQPPTDAKPPQPDRKEPPNDTEKQSESGEKPPDCTEEPNAPPVDYGKDGKPVVVSRYSDAVAHVRSVLTGYVGRRVHVRDVGPCRVLLVGETTLSDCALAVTVYPFDAERTVDVPWREIHYTNEPILRSVSPKPPNSTDAETMNDRTDEQNTNERTDERDVVERFTEAARYSTVTIVQRDGTRVRTRKDHRTGDVVETVLPPKGT